MTFKRPKGLAGDSHVVNNTYECPCGNTWEDSWDSGCDDECGACGKAISPSASHDDPDCDCAGCKAQPQNGAIIIGKIQPDTIVGSSPYLQPCESCGMRMAPHMLDSKPRYLRRAVIDWLPGPVIRWLMHRAYERGADFDHLEGPCCYGQGYNIGQPV